MSTLTDPYGWDEPEPTRPATPPAAAPDARFTHERYEQLLEADRTVERSLPWKQLLALLLVVAIVIARQLWFL